MNDTTLIELAPTAPRPNLLGTAAKQLVLGIFPRSFRRFISSCTWSNNSVPTIGGWLPCT